MDLNFSKLFKIMHRVMKINGTYPAIERNKRWLLLILIPQIINFFVSTAFMYNIKEDLNNKDFAKTCKDGTLVIVYITFTYQFWIMIWKKDLINDLFRTVKNDYEKAKHLNFEEQQIVFDYAMQGVYVRKQWMVISICGASTFFIKNFFLNIYYYVIDDLHLIHPYDLIYPPIIEVRKNFLPIFLIIYFTFLYFAVYGGLIYTCFVPLGPTFMLHACGKLDLLTRRIEMIFDGNKNVLAELKNIIRDLQEIYSFVDKIKETCRLVYQLTFTSTCIGLPATVYEVIEAFGQGDVSLEFITFIVGGVLISSSPCYYSEMLMEKGYKFRLAVYSCGWENTYDRRIRSILTLLLLRTNQPIAIRTMFRTVCLDALAELFHQSYAIFNLMNATWN